MNERCHEKPAALSEEDAQKWLKWVADMRARLHRAERRNKRNLEMCLREPNFFDGIASKKECGKKAVLFDFLSRRLDWVEGSAFHALGASPSKPEPPTLPSELEGMTPEELERLSWRDIGHDCSLIFYGKRHAPPLPEQAKTAAGRSLQSESGCYDGGPFAPYDKPTQSAREWLEWCAVMRHALSLRIAVNDRERRMCEIVLRKDPGRLGLTGEPIIDETVRHLEELEFASVVNAYLSERLKWLELRALTVLGLYRGSVDVPAIPAELERASVGRIMESLGHEDIYGHWSLLLFGRRGGPQPSSDEWSVDEPDDFA